MLQFAWFWMLLLFPLPWVMRRVLPSVDMRSGGVLYAPFILDLEESPSAQRSNIPGWRKWLVLLIWLFLVVAAMRPQWLGDPIELPENGRNLLLAVDVSGSMKMTDLDPEAERVTRLDATKEVAGEFISRRKGDRLGLVLFGSRAYLQVPLTFDRPTVAALLNDSQIGIAGRETAIGDAIGLAIKRLQKSPKGKSVLILLTDGANNAGNVPPRKAAELAKQAGLRIYTIGVGADRMIVNSVFGRQLVNPSEDLDEDTLTFIATTTGGRYFRAQDKKALKAIYAELDKLEPVSGGERSVRPIMSLYPWPLSIALVLTLFWALIEVLSLPGRKEAES
jgi:Ca-activated chloride channel family protein